jgi:1-acyl-sn-glycerol-3-phosphate acyltransferase
MAYWALKAVLTPLLRILFRVRIEGRENVPRRGPVILASNHQSFIDSIFLPLSVRRRVTFVAKAEYFETWKTAWFFRSVGMIPLKRDGGSASERALAAAAEVLKGGGVLGIYPEGTRSPDGRLYKGHTGAARLAMQCNAPVVPVAQLGTAEVQPIGARIVKPFRQVRVRMGPQLWFSTPGTSSPSPVLPSTPTGDAPGTSGTGATSPPLRRFTDEIMQAIAALSGQETVAEYAKRDRGRGSAPGSEAEAFPETGPGAAAAAVASS